MSSFDSIRIGKVGLAADRNALETTGHNIANVNTPSYSRQRAHFGTLPPQVYSYGILGRGSQTLTVEQVVSEYLEIRVRETLSGFEHLEEKQSAYAHLEAIFNELSDTDLSTAANGFCWPKHALREW